MLLSFFGDKHENKHLLKRTRRVKNQGLGILYGDILINSLLLMDDIAVCSHCPVEMQSMLSVIYSFSLKWHLKFSKKKSKILIINETEDTQNLEWQLGTMTIERCSEHTYLGEIIPYDLKEKEKKVETALQTTMSPSTEPVLNRIIMNVITKVYETCIIPIIIYGAETWTPTNSELEYSKKIQNKLIRQLLKVPTTTLLPSLVGELGFYCLTQKINYHQMIYLWKIYNMNNNRLVRKVINVQKEHFQNDGYCRINYVEGKIMQIYFEDTNVPIPNNYTKTKWKKLVKQRITDISNKKFLHESNIRSKMTMIIQHKQKIKKEPYMQLTREHASTIFKIRTRMLDIKNNFRNKYNSSLTSRLCKTCMETQTHILEECDSLDIIRKQHGLDKQPIERVAFVTVQWTFYAKYQNM